MTREEAILWMRVLKHSKINWVGEKAEEEDIIKRCEEAEQEAFDMAIEALKAEETMVIQTGQTHGKSAYIKELAEVVRCKDCRWWSCTDPLYQHNSHLCRYWKSTNTSAEDFCSYGERREP